MNTLARPCTGCGIIVYAVGQAGPPAPGQLGTDWLGDSTASRTWDTTKNIVQKCILLQGWPAASWAPLGRAPAD